MTVFESACRVVGPRQDEDPEGWHAARRKLITASDLADLLGHGRRDAFSVFHDKVNPEPYCELATLDDPRVWGTVWEWPTCQRVARFEKWVDARRGGELLESLKYPGLGATLDAEILRTHEEGWIAYEGKISQWADGWDEELETTPIAFMIQAQGQLMVTQAPKDLIFGVIRGCKTKRVFVTPHEALQRTIEGAYLAFLDCVRRAEPPPVTARSLATLDRLYPQSDGSSILLPPEALEWTREYLDAIAKIKELEEAKDEIRARVKDALGTATYGELLEDVDGKGRWKWKETVNGNRVCQPVKADIVARRRALPALPTDPNKRIAGLPAVTPALAELLQKTLDESLYLPGQSPAELMERMKAIDLKRIEDGSPPLGLSIISAQPTPDEIERGRFKPVSVGYVPPPGFEEFDAGALPGEARPNYQTFGTNNETPAAANAKRKRYQTRRK